MSKTTTTAKMRTDGTVVEVLGDGSERPFPKRPIRPMTEAEIEAAAAADPDARPMTPEELEDGAPGAAREDIAARTRPDPAGICRALPDSARHIA